MRQKLTIASKQFVDVLYRMAFVDPVDTVGQPSLRVHIVKLAAFSREQIVKR